jgi:hypothetical protein
MKSMISIIDMSLLRDVRADLLSQRSLASSSIPSWVDDS